MHFAQKPEESIYQTWERFKETLLQCPHHGYTMSNLLAFFYNGLTPKMKEYVELMCNGQFFEKTQYEAWAYIETIAEHATRWEPRQEGFDRLTTSVGGGSLEKEGSILARMDSLNKRLHHLKMRPLKKNVPCVMQQAITTDICPNLHSLKAIMQHPKEAANWIQDGLRGQNFGSSNQSQQQQFQQRQGFGNQQFSNQFQPMPPIQNFAQPQQQRMPEPPSEIQSLNSTVQQMMQHMMSMQEESRKNNDNIYKVICLLTRQRKTM